MSVATVEPERRPSDALGWAAALLVVVGLHAGVGWWLLGRGFAPPPPAEGVAGITIDLEPVAVPVAPTAAPQPLQTAGPAPAPQPAEAPAPPPEPTPPEAAAPPEPPPMPAPEPPKAEPAASPEPAPAAVPTPPVETPPQPAVPEVAQPGEAVLAPMPPARPAQPPEARPRPVPRTPAPPKPDPRRLAREAAKREAQAEARAQAATDARERRQAARAARAAAAREGGGAARDTAAPVASGAEVASWRGAVVAHLNAYKPASPSGSGGTVRVAFTVDRGGRVVSASVAGSSGDAALDAAAVSMVRQASPVPAPPPELGGRIPLAVPVRFH